MILITKCPHCQTSFKVTDDQLKLYDGAVRCGVCQQIFNGAENLLEEETEELTDPISLHEGALQSRQGKAPLLSEEKEEKTLEEKEEPPLVIDRGQPEDEEDDEMLLSLSEEAINAAAAKREALFNQLEKELSEVTLAIEKAQQEEQRQVPIDSLFAPPKKTPKVKEPPVISTMPQSPVLIQEIVGLTESNIDKERIPFTQAKEKGQLLSSAPRLDREIKLKAKVEEKPKVKPDVKEVQKTKAIDPLLEEPSNARKAFHQVAEMGDDDEEIFMKDLPGRKRPPTFMPRNKAARKRGVFGSLIVAFVMFALIAGVVIQGLYIFSDKIVMWMPSTEKMVIGICEKLSCPRRLEAKISDLSIEANEFELIPELKNKYLLQLNIRNNATSYQMWPHIELTLTDAEKKPTIRRVLSPANYLSDANRIISGIAPNTEETVKVYFEMKDLPTTDYRVVLFYP